MTFVQQQVDAIEANSRIIACHCLVHGILQHHKLARCHLDDVYSGRLRDIHDL
jgi:hypothetical protein